MIRWILLAVFAASPAATAAAQDSSRAARTPGSGGCFHAGSVPACRPFWITEAAYALRSNHYGRDVLVSVDVGGMKHLSPRLALGGSLAAGLMSDLYLAAKPRVRYWFTPDWSGDFAPGVVLKGMSGAHRFTADASVMYRNQVGVTFQGFLLPATVYNQTSGSYSTANRLVVFTGLRFGSKPGLIGIAADAAALVVTIVAFAAACSHGCD